MSLPCFGAFLLFATLPCAAQSSISQPPVKANAPTSQKDVLIFNDGEKLIGTLQRSTGTSVVFHSDMAGDVTVDWSKVKELQSEQKMAVIPKGLNVTKKADAEKVIEGDVSVSDSKLRVAKNGSEPLAILPVSETADVINAAAYENAVLHRPAWYQKWKGSATVGISLVNATQTSRNYTSAVSLVRAIPGEDWMNPENRTSFNFTSAYGNLIQPNTPEVKTSIYHADGERDHYFSPRLFWFGEATFGHDYSQGLDLEQTYGTGIGWTLRKSDKSQVDIKTQLTYVSQMFSDAATNKNLIGSVFSESFTRKMLKRITIHEDVSAAPSWSILRAYSATGNANLTVPIIKRLNFTAGVLDTFLNDPSPGFRKNSLQFTSGITLVIP